VDKGGLVGLEFRGRILQHREKKGRATWFLSFPKLGRAPMREELP